MNTTSNNIKKMYSVQATHSFYQVEHDNKTYLAIDVKFKNLKDIAERKIFHTDGKKMTVNGIDVPIPTEEIKIFENLDLYKKLYYTISDLIKTL